MAAAPLTQLLACDTSPVETWLHNLAATESTASLRCQYRDRLGQQRECRIAARAIIEQGICKGFRGTCSDITDEVAAHAQIQHLSLHDALTGLPNRNKLFRFLEQDQPVPVAVLMLDLDNFKPINDSLGHPAGDTVLIEVARRLGEVTRDSDLVARLGGDEFIVVLVRPGQREEMDRFCARLIDTLRRPITLGACRAGRGEPGRGALGRVPRHPGDLIRYADVALYSAKQAGKTPGAISRRR